MKSRNKDFRVVNEFEWQIIKDSLNQISLKILTTLQKMDFKFIISFKDAFPSIYLVQDDKLRIIEGLDEGLKINSAGLFVGFIKNNRYLLSIEGAEFFNDRGCFSENSFLIANYKGEKSILYGNNIQKKMIVNFPKKFKIKDFLLVFNLKKEIIAIALSKINEDMINKTNSNEIVALNLVDKGYYLRKKQ